MNEGERDELDERIHHLLSATVSEKNEDFDPGDPDEVEPEYITHGESECGQDDWREDVYTSIRSRVTCPECLRRIASALEAASHQERRAGE